MKKGFLSAIFLVVVICCSYGQDPLFSQFYANRLYLNPAFAGTANCPRLTLNYRNQWPGIDNSFVTYAASFDKQSESISGGYGIQLLSDQAGEGVLSTTSAALMYSYQFNVNRRFSIRAGFQGTVVQKAINTNNLVLGDMIDARRGVIYETQEQINNENVLYPDFSFGMIGFSEKLYFGFAAHHLTSPDEGFIDLAVLQRRIVGHFGAKLPFGFRVPDLFYSPNIIFQKQGDATEINTGIYVSKGPVVLGTWFRNSIGKDENETGANRDALIFLVGLETDKIKIGYSYDVTISDLNGNTNGAHEISMSYTFPCSPKKTRFETISCPSF